MIRHPGIKQPGTHCDAVVETVDVFPTLTELCHLEAPATLDGRSLMPQLADPSVETTKPAVGFWGGGQRTVRTDRWRLIVSKPKGEKAEQVELFDYDADPEETNNHADANPPLSQIFFNSSAKLLRAPSFAIAALVATAQRICSASM